jgi:hypothetical protein
MRSTVWNREEGEVGMCEYDLPWELVSIVMVISHETNFGWQWHFKSGVGLWMSKYDLMVLVCFSVCFIL